MIWQNILLVFLATVEAAVVDDSHFNLKLQKFNFSRFHFLFVFHLDIFPPLFCFANSTLFA